MVQVDQVKSKKVELLPMAPATVQAALTELLSDPKLSVDVAKTLCDLPAIEIGNDYWQLEPCERKFLRSDDELVWATH